MQTGDKNAQNRNGIPLLNFQIQFLLVRVNHGFAKTEQCLSLYVWFLRRFKSKTFNFYSGLGFSRMSVWLNLN